MAADDQLALALSEWQRKHKIDDADPMLAVLDLVRLAIQHPPAPTSTSASLPPSFEEFRGTMELLDARSKDFVKQSTALVGELRTLAQAIQRMNDGRTGTIVLMLVLGLVAGLGIGSHLWK